MHAGRHAPAPSVRTRGHPSTTKPLHPRCNPPSLRISTRPASIARCRAPDAKFLTLEAVMKVLLIGNGGREHALAWKLADSPHVTALYAAPGNPGTAQFAENVNIDPMKFPAVERFVRQNKIELVVIGPEDPLAAGLADFVQS